MIATDAAMYLVSMAMHVELVAGKLQIDPNSNSIVTVSVTRSSPSILPVELAGKALEMMLDSGSVVSYY